MQRVVSNTNLLHLVQNQLTSNLKNLREHGSHYLTNKEK